MNLLTSIDIPIVLVGSDLKIRHFTPRAAQLLKLIPTDVGRSIGGVKPEIGVQNLDELIIEVMDSMTSKEIETQDSSRAWYKLQIRPYRTAENKIDGAVISFIDIDALKRIMTELKQSHEDAVVTIETMPISLLIITSDLKIKLANNVFYEKFKTTKSETEGRRISDLGNGQWNIPEFLKILERTITEKIRFHKFEIEHSFPKIGKKIMILNASYAHLPGSSVDIALLAIEDITEIRMAERKLKSSEEKCFNLLTSSYEGIMVLQRDGKIEFTNPMLEKIFGYEPKELLGKNYIILIAGENPEAKFALKPEEMLETQSRSLGREIFLDGIKKNGSTIPLLVSLSAFKSNSEFLINCTVRDITEQKNLDAAKKLLLAKEKELLSEAEKTNRIKDEFLATLSHELRTPLTAILGWAQELKNSNLDQKTISVGLAVIERSAHTQGQLINELLDISRIQSSKLPLEMKIIDLVKLLDVATDSIRHLADSKSIVIAKIFENLTFNVFADSTRLQQVFWNLLTNAVKFTPNGGNISVSIEAEASRNGQNAVVKITDTGLGIKPEFIHQLFQRFSQADSSTARNYGGLGLGLAIAKSLVEMQNGKIFAKSEGQGKGATFSIVLPMILKSQNEIDTSAAQPEVSKKSVRLDGAKILAVDDNEDNRDLFAIILQSLGAEVRLAGSAKEAMKILAEYKPDLVLSDISMPGEDGFSLLSQIRQREKKLELKSVPVVALTAHAAQDDIRRVLAAGFNEHIAKPVEKSILSNVIKRFTST